MCSCSELVSVVVPTKNRPELLQLTLRSLVKQTADIAIIVCDDNSTELNKSKNKAICSENNVVYLSNPGPFGVAHARNYGVANSASKYIAFCDDDDLWLPNKTSNQLSMLESENRSWVYSHVVIADEYLNPLSINTGSLHKGADIYTGNRVPGGCSSVMIERALFESVGRFDGRYSMFADWELWIRLTKHQLPVVSPSLDVVYVSHKKQMSSNYEMAREELEAVFSQHNIIRSSYKQSLLDIDRWVARRCVLSGNYFTGLQHIIKNKNEFDFKLMKLMVSVFAKTFWIGGLKNRDSTAVAQVSTEEMRRILNMSV